MLAVSSLGVREVGASSRLLYSRTSGAMHCPDERALRAAIGVRLGYDAFSPWGEGAVVAEIADEGGFLRARLRLVDEQGLIVGARELDATSNDCEELVRALALAIAIALDPMAAPDREAPELAAPTEESPPTNDGAPLVADEREPDAPSLDVAPRSRVTTSARTLDHSELGRRTHVSVRVGPLVWLGVAPGPAYGRRAGVGVRRGAFKLLAEVEKTLPASEASRLGGRAHVELTAGSIAPCITHAFVAGCGLVVLGQLSSYATGVESSRAGVAFHSAAGVRLESLIALSPTWELALSADGLKTLSSVRVFLHDQPLWSTAPFTAALGVSASFIFQ